MNIEQYLDPQYGIFDYLMEQKKAGKIKHLGFSCHGNMDILTRFLEAYGEHMEFCQLQLNYLDWSFQDDKSKVELLNKWGIPIWVMEPLRGGSLAKLSDEHEKTLKAIRPDASMVEWAFRYLQSIPNVVTILSGMSNEEQTKDNLRIFQDEKPLSEDEISALYKIAEDMLQVKTVPCTACHYCVSHCPQELDIPHLLSLYNEHVFTGGGFIAPMALSALDKDKRPKDCIACGACEQVCPQEIKISECMSDFAEKL